MGRLNPAVPIKRQDLLTQVTRCKSMLRSSTYWLKESHDPLEERHCNIMEMICGNHSLGPSPKGHMAISSDNIKGKI